ncbi:MAG: TIM barrel protein [Alphaproteobacteria bacterium]
MTLRFTANLSWLCKEVDLPDRFALAASLGFEAVECGLPYEVSAEEFIAGWKKGGLPLVMINAATGDMAAGEYGLAALPGREADFRAALEASLAYALPTGCRFLHVLAGIVPPDVDNSVCADIYVENLKWACDVCAGHGMQVLIEPINTVERPGYFLSRTDQAAAVIDRVGRGDIGIQYDTHNAQLMEGDLTRTLTRFFYKIHHIQVAGLPDRSPPDRGEVDHDHIFDLLERLGYDGWIGCEYRPGPDTAATLGWAERFGIGP